MAAESARGGSEQSRFRFLGTVRRVNAATMPQVPVTAGTIVVSVDEVLHAPEALAGWTGKEITVQIPEGQRAQAGQQMVFDTTGWLYGESIAVRSVGQRIAEARHPTEVLADRDLGEHLNEADLVVTGQVMAVTMPPAIREQAVPGAAPRPALSEHDPEWRVATVRVDAVEKGEHPEQEVQVAFPASTDVAWYRAPKFHAGQQGAFLLHRSAPARPAAVAEAAGEEPTAPAPYIALHPLDFQASDRVEQVRSLVRGGPASEETPSVPEQ